MTSFSRWREVGLRRLRWLGVGMAVLGVLAPARGRAQAPAGAESPAPGVPKVKVPAGRLLTLPQAYQRALETDQSIRIAYYELRKANLAPWSALTRLGPVSSGSSGYTRGESALVGGSSSRSEARSASVSLNQPLFDLTVFPAYRLGKLTARAARMQQLFTVRETLFTVAQSYYAVLKDESVLHVDEESVRLAQEQFDLAQTRFNAGAAARSDVLTARATLEDARRTFFQDQRTLALDRNTLANALNLSADDFVLAEPVAASEDVKDFSFYLSQAYARREDFQVSKIAVDQDVARRGQIVAEYVPSIGASASSGLNSSTGGQTRSWSAGLSVSVPILSGGQREIDLRSAGHDIAESKLRLEQTTKSVQADVRTTWEQVKTLRETIQALKAQVEANEQNYKDVQTQYKVGSSTSVDVQVALRDLNSSRSLLAAEVYDYQVALRDLQRAAGLFESERIMKTNLK